MKALSGLLLVLTFALCAPALSGAQDAHLQAITVFSSNGLRAVLTELVPIFERRTGQKVIITYSVAAELKRRIDQGAPFDVTVLTPALIDDLISRGLVSAASRTALARSGMALAVRSGQPRPDIRTTDALTRTLRETASIAFAREGAGGLFFSALMPRLGLSDVLAPKLRPFTTGTDVSAALARGDAELGLLPLSELLGVPGVDIVGPFPPDIQGYAVMVAGVATHAAQPADAKHFIDFVASAEMTPSVIGHGMERIP